jgi:hypothetical protein
MKQMQNFQKRMSSNTASLTLRERCLAALTRLSRDQVNSFAAFEPWFIWGAETAIEAK